jgi:hypothetical protein
MKIFKNMFLIIGIILTIGLVIFWQPMLNFLGNIGFDDLQIINSFLGIIISWPLAIFVLGITFLLRFTDQIREFLKNMRSFRFGNVEASARQSEALIEDKVIQVENQTDLVSKEEFEKMLINKDSEIENIKKAFVFARERAENYEMAYLKRALVPFSWLALNWLFTQDNRKATKEWFTQSISVVDSAPDKTAEKEAIFNALLVNELITYKDNIMLPTDKAEKFLKYVGVIK